MQDDDEVELYEGPSRTAKSRARKADEARLSALASSLVGMSRKQLAMLMLEESLLDEVAEARRMKSHAARARQMRLVRRALRGSDSHAIGEAVDAILRPGGAPSPLTLKAQNWSQRLMDEGNAALEAFLSEHPDAERQQLNNLLRNLRKAIAAPEAAANAKKASKARKTLRLAIEKHLAATKAP